LDDPPGERVAVRVAAGKREARGGRGPRLQRAAIAPWWPVAQHDLDPLVVDGVDRAPIRRRGDRGRADVEQGARADARAPQPGGSRGRDVEGVDLDVRGDD